MSGAVAIHAAPLKVSDRTAAPQNYTLLDTYPAPAADPSPSRPRMSAISRNVSQHFNTQVVTRSGLRSGLPIGALVVAYILLGVCMFSYVSEHLSIEDSLYYIIVTITTVGYGDVVPTESTKMFMIFYILFGVIIFGLALGLLGEYLVERQAEVMKNMEQKSRKVLLNSFTNSGPAMEMDLSVRPSEREADLSLPTDHERSALYQSLVHFTLPIAVFVVLGAAVIGHLEDWNLLDTVYWMVVTATTIGYGDESPKHHVSRWLCLLYIPAAVAMTAELFSKIAWHVIERNMHEGKQLDLLARLVNLEGFDQMDTDNDGQLSEFEYVSFMLTQMGYVEDTVLATLRAQFNQMDIDRGGSITKEELGAIASGRVQEFVAASEQSKSNAVRQAGRRYSSAFSI
mmetsp:Transcript_39265/g.76662  ORF Transcript_39265/g.76662 Transcript_39265/m.76662 type:complete len:399 (+) Transcript_39265:256-1452(+)